MDLHDYIRIVRKRWKAIVAAALIGLIAAGFFVATATKKYTASVRLFVSTQNTADASLTSAVQGSDFSQARVTSYVDIVNTPPVMAGVISALKLNTTPQALAGQVSASAPTDTVLLNINVTDADAKQSALIANATALSFINVVTQLEKPADGSPSPIRVAVVKQASVPTGPTSPKKQLDLAIGLLVGLVLGLAIAVVSDMLDTSLKNPDDLAELSGEPTLAIIGFDPEVSTTPLVIDGSPHTPRAEALRQLRTNLQFVDVDNPPKSVLVTSAVPKEGKSSTTTNLALTLARGGKSVILVEGDLRRPRVARYLGMPEDLPGITDVLVGKYTLDEALTPFRDEKLMLLSSGATPPNPSELLGSESMGELIRQLTERADVVLIDAPPLLPVTDGAVLATQCDGALFVVRAGKTRREQVARAMDNLESVDARLLGTVLNMASAKGPEAYAYGYGYEYNDKPGKKSKKKAKSAASEASAAAKPQLTVPEVVADSLAAEAAKLMARSAAPAAQAEPATGKGKSVETTAVETTANETTVVETTPVETMTAETTAVETVEASTSVAVLETPTVEELEQALAVEAEPAPAAKQSGLERLRSIKQRRA